MATERRATGHLLLEDRKGGRVWVAVGRFGAAGRTRKVLGPAWAKDSGKRTAHGATVWRAGAGTKPGGHLTPKEAEERLRQWLDELPKQRASAESHHA